QLQILGIDGRHILLGNFPRTVATTHQDENECEATTHQDDGADRETNDEPGVGLCPGWAGLPSVGRVTVRLLRVEWLPLLAVGLPGHTLRWIRLSLLLSVR